MTYDPPLDPGIRRAVEVLGAAGVETFESCQGGPGHAYPEPTVRFHGDRSEGFRALAAAMQEGLPVVALRRVWTINDGEPAGPWWEMTFVGFDDDVEVARESLREFEREGGVSLSELKKELDADTSTCGSWDDEW